jgi:hypothetical protein
VSFDLTLVYLTNRIDPKFDWFFDSLANEGFNGPIIVIDHLAEVDYRLSNKHYEAFPGLIHTLPKPCVWQGKYKLTKNEYFAAANARNTGFALCNTSHIAFVDDLTVVMPGWLAQAQHACANSYVMAGAYKKLWEMQVENGVLVNYREERSGIDSRWGLGSDSGIVPITGGCLFGCNFVLPMEFVLKINGQDEQWDSLGGEDFDMGIRLTRAGYGIYYNRNARTYESEEGHHTSNFKVIHSRLDKPCEGTYSSNVLLNRLNNDSLRYWSLGNQWTLPELRNHYAVHGEFPIPTKPTHHWVDGQPLSEM